MKEATVIAIVRACHILSYYYVSGPLGIVLQVLTHLTVKKRKMWNMYIIVPILWWIKLRFQAVQLHDWGHTTWKKQWQNLNPGSLAAESMLLTTLLHWIQCSMQHGINSRDGLTKEWPYEMSFDQMEVLPPSLSNFILQANHQAGNPRSITHIYKFGLQWRFFPFYLIL